MNSFVKYKELLKPSYIPKEINIPKKFINKRFLVNILKEMIRIREVEYFLAEKKRDGHIIGPVHLGVGQEAIPVTLSAFLDRSDQVFGAHRSHGHLLALGGDEYKLFSEVLGRESGFSKGMGGSMHLIDKENGFYGSVPIVSGTVSLALGSALANKIQKNNQLSIAYLGDGAVEEGIFHEALNMASIFEIPILFVCENNYYSIFTHIKDRQPSDDMTRFAKAHHIKSLRASGYDLNIVDKKARYAINEIKKNKRPFFIQFDNYRFLEHCGPNDDDHKNYRPISEQKLWKTKDPVKLFSKSLLRKKIINSKELLNLDKKIQSKIDKMFHKSILAPLPKASNAKNHTYA